MTYEDHDEIELIAHAAVVLRLGPVVLLTDPWFAGRAFNESWALAPPAALRPGLLDEVTHLWISHEHPDHFHVPTLKGLPDAFKERVEVLFQETPTPKVPDALRRMGFRSIRTLPNRQWCSLAPGIQVWCAQFGSLDSCLAMQGRGRTLLVLNDCEVDPSEYAGLRAAVGAPDVLLAQFSLAGYTGEELDRDATLRADARRDLDGLVEQHRALGAGYTLPFASFVYFCRSDNAYMNHYANSVADVVARFQPEGLELAVLWPGDRWRLDDAPPSEHAVARHEEFAARVELRPIEPATPVPLDAVEAAFHARSRRLRENHPVWLLRLLLAPLRVRLPDHDDAEVVLDLANDRWSVGPPSPDPDLSVCSQPLQFALRWPFGVQTLGVSARLVVHRRRELWRRHRYLFSLDNMDLPLRPSRLLRRERLGWLARRLPGLAAQVRHKLARDREDRSAR